MNTNMTGFKWFSKIFLKTKASVLEGLNYILVQGYVDAADLNILFNDAC